MTIKEKKAYTFPINSENNSDVESLHLGNTSASASDAESLQGESNLVFRPSGTKTRHEDLIHLKKTSGKRRVRRYQNRCHLQTLAEEDEDEAFFVVMEPYLSPFTKLLQDDDALEFWNVFIGKSQEEQAQVLDSFSKTKKIDANNDKTSPRISPKIKRTIKIKKNLSLEQVRVSEDGVIAFFTVTPKEIYVQHPPTYFQRILLHAIAQYHGLKSLGIVENGNRRVEVFSTIDNWTPAECLLTDFVAQLRK